MAKALEHDIFDALVERLLRPSDLLGERRGPKERPGDPDRRCFGKPPAQDTPS